MVRLGNYFEIFITANPDDVKHIMQTNPNLYIKGDEWRKRFDFFGNSYFNSDSDDLRLQKVALRNFLGHQQFQRLIKEAFRRSVDELLLTDLMSAADAGGSSVDIAEYFRRFTFRVTAEAFTGCGFIRDIVPLVKRFSEAISDSFEAVLLRYLLPCWFWGTQKWLRMGAERKASQATETLNQIAEDFIQNKTSSSDGDLDFSFLNLCLTKHKLMESVPEDVRILRQNIFGLLFAAGDTTSTTLIWFFHLLTKHHQVEAKLVDEIDKWWPKHEPVLGFGAEELKNMVYLHATLCETLRMFPPIGFEARTPVCADTLPSGHHISTRTRVFLAIYAMGRMEHVWEEDCREFKPERWITPEGGIKYEPPHKFFVFSAGQRMCPGKDIAFGLMKAAICNVLYNYHVEVEQDGPMYLKANILLQMKNDVMAKIKKRSGRAFKNFE